MDLVVATLQLPCIGHLETSSVLPCAGLHAFDHQRGQIALSLQLFAHGRQPHKPLYVLQQRAPAAKGCQRQYAQDLAQWVSDSGFEEVQDMHHKWLLQCLSSAAATHMTSRAHCEHLHCSSHKTVCRWFLLVA